MPTQQNIVTKKLCTADIVKLNSISPFEMYAIASWHTPSGPQMPSQSLLSAEYRFVNARQTVLALYCTYFFPTQPSLLTDCTRRLPFALTTALKCIRLLWTLFDVRRSARWKYCLDTTAWPGVVSGQLRFE